MARLYCQSCDYLMAQCVCDLIPIDTVLPVFEVFVVQHDRESKHAKNTIKLLKSAWPFIHIMRVDDTDLSADVSDKLEYMKEQGGFYLLYPTEKSEAIEELAEAVKQSIKGLVIIDATWKKSLRLLNLYPSLKEFPALCFSNKKDSVYTIRKSPNEMALSSFEAIIYSHASLQQESKTTESMLNFMVNAQNRLWKQRPK